jgi:hypothetical protein
MRNDSITRVKNISTQNYAYSSTNLLAYDDYESLKAKVMKIIFTIHGAVIGN